MGQEARGVCWEQPQQFSPRDGRPLNCAMREGRCERRTSGGGSRRSNRQSISCQSDAGIGGGCRRCASTTILNWGGTIVAVRVRPKRTRRGLPLGAIHLPLLLLLGCFLVTSIGQRRGFLRRRGLLWCRTLRVCERQHRNNGLAGLPRASLGGLCRNPVCRRHGGQVAFSGEDAESAARRTARGSHATLKTRGAKKDGVDAGRRGRSRT